jgi:hypothetical protein
VRQRWFACSANVSGRFGFEWGIGQPFEQRRDHHRNRHIETTTIPRSGLQLTLAAHAPVELDDPDASAPSVLELQQVDDDLRMVPARRRR